MLTHAHIFRHRLDTEKGISRVIYKRIFFALYFAILRCALRYVYIYVDIWRGLKVSPGYTMPDSCLRLYVLWRCFSCICHSANLKRSALITIADREWPPRVCNVWKFLTSSRLSAVRRVASVEVRSKTKRSDVCTVYRGNLFH